MHGPLGYGTHGSSAELQAIPMHGQVPGFDGQKPIEQRRFWGPPARIIVRARCEASACLCTQCGVGGTDAAS